MKSIKLGSRKYDYFMSASVAKKNGYIIIELLKDSEAGKEPELGKMIDTYANMVYDGIKSARICEPWIKRQILNLIKPIPSPDLIQNLIDFETMQDLVDGKSEASKKK